MIQQSRRDFGASLLSVLAALATLGKASATETGKTHVVEIAGAAFIPASIELSTGDSITWINRDIVPHTATALDQSWDSGILQSGEQYTHRFDNEVSAEYFCRLHPGMRASLRF